MKRCSLELLKWYYICRGKLVVFIMGSLLLRNVEIKTICLIVLFSLALSLSHAWHFFGVTLCCHSLFEWVEPQYTERKHCHCVADMQLIGDWNLCSITYWFQPTNFSIHLGKAKAVSLCYKVKMILDLKQAQSVALWSVLTPVLTPPLSPDINITFPS